MIKKMAGKLQHLGHSKSAATCSGSISSSSAASTSTLSVEQRASMSTERTSLSEWSRKAGRAETDERDDHDDPDDRMQISDISEIPRIPPSVRRSRGSYRLSDFIIQRTLGTGSFGRVHLGAVSSPAVCFREVISELSLRPLLLLRLLLLFLLWGDCQDKKSRRDADYYCLPLTSSFS